MPTEDVWSNPSFAGPIEAARMAAFLEERACCPDQLQAQAALRREVAAVSGEHILEVGSGSGVLSRLVAEDVVPTGHVTGLDISPDLTEAARTYAASAGLAAVITFETGEAESLPYDAGSFDVAFAARLLLHAGDPRLVMRELRRVVRRGGRVVLMDWDFGTVAVDHTDRALTRRILEWRCDHHGGDNWSGRTLRSHLIEAGFRDVRVTAIVCLALDDASSLTASLWRAADVALAGGAISQAEHTAWRGDLDARLASSRFCASVVHFIAKGDR